MSETKKLDLMEIDIHKRLDHIETQLTVLIEKLTAFEALIQKLTPLVGMFGGGMFGGLFGGTTAIKRP